MRATPSAAAPSSDASLRQLVFTGAISAAIKRGCDDSELLVALGKLWMDENPEGSPSALFAGAIPAHLPAPAAPMVDFLFWCAQSDGLGCREAGASAILYAATAPISPPPRGAAPPGPPLSLLALARSPWARSMGLLLNEARPNEAPLWPLFCALGPMDPKELSAISRQSGRLGPRHAKARDDFLALACETGHAPLFERALTALPSVPPSEACWAACCSALTREHRHSGARAELGVRDEPALAGPEMASRLSGSLALPGLDQQLLESVCMAQMRLPAALADTPWQATAAALASRGSAQLGLDALLGLARRAMDEEAALSARLDRSFREPCARLGGREMNASALDELAASCVKAALLPRGGPAVDTGSPPLPFVLAGMLSAAGPKARVRIVSAMDRWASNGFGREALAWRRTVAGQTQSIGSAIAHLPKGGGGARNFEPQISAWLVALAAQGFDFEAKATPKSKSLGEKLRSTASLNVFWTLIESKALAVSTLAAAPSRRSQPL